MSEISTAVLGCGVIGASWVTAFRDAGHVVRIWDPNAGAAQAVAARHDGGVIVLASPEEAVDGANFIQENGPEDILVKRELLGRIGPRLTTRAIIATSSSTLQASDLQRGFDFADRLLVGHPFNPPHILPLVEVVGGVETAEWAIEEAMRFYAAAGKHPIQLRLERPGHLANRLQAALWREAVDAVASGQASVADVDAAVTLALGPRWALTGPFATFALAGGKGGLAHFLDHLGAPFEALWDDAQRPQMTASLKKELVAETSSEPGGASSIDVQERDRRLLQILALALQDDAR